MTKKDERIEKLIKKRKEEFVKRVKEMEREEKERELGIKEERKKTKEEPSKIEEESLKKKEKIELISIREISKRRGPPMRAETTEKQINRFEEMTNLFKKKVNMCNLERITRDLIEAEYLTKDIDKNIGLLQNKSMARYYRLLEQYKDSVAFLENNCKCSPKMVR